MELSKEEMELFLHSPVIRSKKLSLRNFPYLVYCFQTVFQKQEMDLSKHEMELFLPFPVIRSKNLSLQKFSYLVYCFQTGYQKQEIELSKQEIELFLHFWAIGSKNFFYKSYPIWFTDPRKVCRNGKWNYFSLFWSSDKKTCFTKVSTFGSMIPKRFPENRKCNHRKRKWNYFSPFQLSDQKTFFT